MRHCSSSSSFRQERLAVKARVTEPLALKTASHLLPFASPLPLLRVGDVLGDTRQISTRESSSYKFTRHINFTESLTLPLLALYRPSPGSLSPIILPTILPTIEVDDMPSARSNQPQYGKDDKVLCFHGELLYEAKVLDTKLSVASDPSSAHQYYVHYKGWKNTYVPVSFLSTIRRLSFLKT